MKKNGLIEGMDDIEKKLKNERFIENAPKSVIDHEKQKFKDMNDEFDLIKTNLDILQ